MKKARKPPTAPETSLDRYDWSRATRGRHASRFPRDAHAVVIAPDVWAHFGSAQAVNDALRLLVKATELASKSPTKTKAKTKARRAA